MRRPARNKPKLTMSNAEIVRKIIATPLKVRNNYEKKAQGEKKMTYHMRNFDPAPLVQQSSPYPSGRFPQIPQSNPNVKNTRTMSSNELIMSPP